MKHVEGLAVQVQTLEHMVRLGSHTNGGARRAPMQPLAIGLRIHLLVVSTLENEEVVSVLGQQCHGVHPTQPLGNSDGSRIGISMHDAFESRKPRELIFRGGYSVRGNVVECGLESVKLMFPLSSGQFKTLELSVQLLDDEVALTAACCCEKNHASKEAWILASQLQCPEASLAVTRDKNRSVGACLRSKSV
jgi:hypothetical protein